MMNGFELKNKVALTELGGELIEMEHTKSGARLLWLNREDVNKTFSITFRTVPNDDTGIFHILEHSVLCGSKKFDVKEPFVELIKNSMNTFLNAMTFPDKTMYPISTKNDKDYFNLMEVYLDAVFYPSIYKRPEIFYQEGWHYELDENEDLSFKGVVFNEMKGVYADADSVLENEICKKLFPNNCYSVESGGHPKCIPNLSYEQFIEGHKTFYHPSNSYIILDGSIDIEKVTAFIDENYLSSFDRIAPCPAPQIQAPVKSERKTVFFEQSKDMPIEGQSKLGFGFVVSSFEDREKIIASHILSDVLCESNQSYLTKALLSKGLCEDVSISLVDGILQPFMLVNVKGIDEKRLDEVDSTIVEALEELKKNGIDKSRLEAAISNLEFSVKEKDFGYPKGLYYAMTAMETWLYDGDPKANLEFGDLFDVLRNKAENGYFEQLIDDVFLNNNHCCSILMTPSHTVGDEDRQEEAKRLADTKASWSREDIEHFKDVQAKLQAWQESEDSPEALASMPMISLEDIDIEPEPLPFEVCENVLKHSVNTDGIIYTSIYFDITGVDECDLPKLSLLGSLLGELDTEQHTATELKTLLQTKCGSVSFAVAPYTDYNKLNSGTIKFVVQFSALERYFDDALSLIHEIITSTKFDNKTAIADIVKQARQSRYQAIVMSGSTIAMKRASTSLSYEAVVFEQTKGLSSYQWLKEQENSLSVVNELPLLMKKVFAKNNAVFSVAGNLDDNICQKANDFISDLGTTDISGALKITPWEKSNDAIVIPGDTSFSGKAYPFESLYGGKSLLMGHIVSFDYLWNEIRVKGGAYGTGFRPTPNGTLVGYSYRDPNSKASVKTYDTVPEYLEKLAKSDRSLVGFIIGAMSSASPLLTPRQVANAAAGNYFRGISYDDRLATRREMVGATMSDLEALAQKIEDAKADSAFCVIASKKQVDSLEGIDNIYSL